MMVCADLALINLTVAQQDWQGSSVFFFYGVRGGSTDQVHFLV